MAATASMSTAYCQDLQEKESLQIYAMKHPTGLHGFVQRWKVGGADNSKGGDSDTVKTNFAEMDVKSASANMASKMCAVPIKITHAEGRRFYI